MADLQELFSRLKSSSSQAPPHGDTSYQPPAVSSPIVSPPISTPNPTSSAILSPKAGTPSQDPKATSLLNLLRFNAASSTQNASPLTAMQNVSSNNGAPEASAASNLSQPKGELETATPKATPAVANPQDFLLNLLRQPGKAAVSSAASPPAPLQAPQAQSNMTDDAVQNLAQATLEFDSSSLLAEPKEQTPVREFGSAKSRETTPFQAPTPGKTSGIFSYVNPFEQLSASTPHRRTPKPEAQPKAKVEPAQPAVVAVTLEEPKPSESTGKRIKKEPAETVPETWQSAPAGSVDEGVKVYEFPMKPFVSIQLSPDMPPAHLRAENIMDIVRLKKEFDQIDRCLVGATKSHIVYAMSKTGGFRIIRQDSGRDKQVFKANQERIFNIQVKESSGSSVADTILAAGVNGSVFWTSVDLADDQAFVDGNLETSGFILPPINGQEENTSGSPVKTRTKMSSRQSDLFAISRGKAIHIISPSLASSAKYADGKTRTIDSTKFFAERSHKITTGKACKDFTFSEDDSVITSLDKAGRIRFWDIRELSESVKAARKSSTELKTPVLTFTASMASEKISPTSVMFLDKERPCVKGIALRYLLVGFKQNHVLQLWDMGLGKPVQELHFPHEKDSDAICSISYHPKTGIIALAHPTRNSVYFIHLSAPRYHIPNMSQAQYSVLLANEDNALPKPESTAILSGIRELSFGSKGHLRSVEMLNTPATSSDETTESEETLFELYAMHSTGVTCLSIKKADLGWSAENKVLSPVNAEKAGFISIGPLAVPSDASVADVVPDKVKSMPSTKADSKPGVNAVSEPKSTREAAPSKDAIVESIETPLTTKPTGPSRINSSYSAVAARGQEVAAPSVMAAKQEILTAVPKAAPLADRTRIPAINGNGTQTSSDASGLFNALTTEFEGLYRRIEGDRRVQDAAASARQDAVLKLVSSTLTDNVERSLMKIVSTSIQEEVLPAVTDVFTALAERRLHEHLNEAVGNVVPQEVRAALPAALSAAFQDPETAQVLAGPVAQQLSQSVTAAMEGIVRTTMTDALAPTIASSIQKAVASIEERHTRSKSEEGHKIDRLANLVFGLSETMQKMSTSQAALQDQIAALRKQIDDGHTPASSGPIAAGIATPKGPEDPEVQEITTLMTEGQFEAGTIQWLQSSRQGELFDKLFVRVNPQYLQKVSPLVKLSVSAAVSTSFEQHVDQRLDWLSNILGTTDLQDPEIVEVAPKIMAVLLTRIQGAYMSFAETNPADPVLRKFSNLSRQITEIRKVLG